MRTYSSTYSSALGTIIIESDGHELTRLRFAEDTINQTNGADGMPIIEEVRQWLDDYFAGKQPCKVPRLNPQGTDFQRKVWQALFTIPYGQTKTYGEIAKLVGCRSSRAVGQAIGHNPIAIIIPCHRVVGTNGTLGGYAWGLDIKQALLELEHCPLGKK